MTDDADAARARAADEFSVYGMLPSYRAMLDREGAAGPADVAIVGDAATVRSARSRTSSRSVVTDFAPALFGSRDRAEGHDARCSPACSDTRREVFRLCEGAPASSSRSVRCSEYPLNVLARSRAQNKQGRTHMSIVRLLPAWLHAVADYAVGGLLIIVALAVGGSNRPSQPVSSSAPSCSPSAC